MNNKEKVLNCLFENSYDTYHIRSLARLVKLNPNTIIAITKELVKEKLIIINKDKETKLTLIKADTTSNNFKLKKRFYNIEKIYSSGLIEFFEKEFDYPCIFLFGSYAKAENIAESDIDLFILTENKKKIDTADFDKKLSAEIQLFVHTKKEFQKLKKDNKELINNILNGIKLSGYIEVV